MTTDLADEKPWRRGVVGVVVEGGRLLVIERSQTVEAPGMFCFPGGGIEPGEAEQAMRLSDELLQRGVFAQGIGFPTVPRGKARVRTIVCTNHTTEQLDRALEAFKGAGKAVGLLP